jgi:activator of 2-hydroxyglutaryl-CoA dehydratase
MGLALDEENATEFTATEIISKLEQDESENLIPQDTLEVLFEDETALAEFRSRHAKEA